jgi:aspartyl protease family protein
LQAIKYSLIWLVIAILMVAAYSYRFEFSDFKKRITREINPSEAIINDEQQIIVNISNDKHFYVNIKINGVPIRFMIDTGASDVMINIADAKKIGVDTKKLVFNKRYETANGMAFGAMIKVNELEISDIKFTNINASINNVDIGVSLLGMSFLRKFTKYEFFQDKLILTK